MLASGWKHLNDGRFAEADRIGRQVLQTDPENADAWHLLAMANLRLGRLSEAESSFLRAIDARPDFLAAHSNLGIMLAQQGRHDEALARFGAPVPSTRTSPMSTTTSAVSFATWGAWTKPHRAFALPSA